APSPGPISATPAGSALARPIIPQSKNARVNPQAGQPGQVFAFEATGYQPGEVVSLWVNVPDGSVLGASFQATADANGAIPAGQDVQMTIVASDGRRTDAGFTVTADANGSIGYAGIYYVTAPGYPLGLYSFVATGKTSGKVSTAYFVLTP